jgi:hypothetical protein
MWLVAGCGPSFSPEYAVIGLRLLAVRADPPEIGPGEKTHLSSLTFDPMGRPIDVSWKLCTLAPSPAESTPVNSACITDQTDLGNYLEDLGSGDAIDFIAPRVDPRTLGIPDVSAGLYLPIRVRVTAGSDTDTGVFGLRYAYAPLPRNHNPSVTDLLDVATEADADGGGEVAAPLAPLRPVQKKDKVTLRTSLSMDSAETYPRISGAPPMLTMATERLTQQWLTTGGMVSGGLLPEDAPYLQFTVDDPAKGRPGAPLPPSGSPIDFWVVLRDGRGGVDWAHRQLFYQ